MGLFHCFDFKILAETLNPNTPRPLNPHTLLFQPIRGSVRPSQNPMRRVDLPLNPKPRNSKPLPQGSKGPNNSVLGFRIVVM